MTQNNSKKRTFSQFHDEDDVQYLDLCESPEPKKQKLNHFTVSNFPTNTHEEPNRSPSIEIISVTIPNTNPCDSKKSLFTDNKENNGDMNNSSSNSISLPSKIETRINSNPSDDNTDNNSIEWINNKDCKITEHRIENEWYEFKIISLLNEGQSLWCKHDELKDLDIYDNYLDDNNLSIAEVDEKVYFIEQIIDHQYNEDIDEIQFNVKWKGYPNEHNSWEPHCMLQDNEIYIKYCKKHGIKPMLTESDGENDDDDSDDEYEEEEIETDSDLQIFGLKINESNDYTIDTNDTNDTSESKDIEDIESDVIEIDIDMNNNNNNNNNMNTDIEIIDITNDDIDIANDDIDIEKEYKLAQRLSKIFSVEYIVEIISVIDKRMEMMFAEPIIHNNNKNTNNKNGNNSQTEIDKLFDIRQYFETLKGELLFKQFRHNSNTNNSNNNSYDNNDNNDNNNMDIDENDDDIIEIIAGTKSKMNIKTPLVQKHERRKTLFDYYSFTPSKSKSNINKNNINKKMKKSPLNRNNKSNTINKSIKKKKYKKRGKKQTHFDNNNNNKSIFSINKNIIHIHDSDTDIEEKDEIPMAYLQQNSTCYACKRKWPLFAVEFFKAFPMCDTCPKNIRLGHNRKFREDWFCPYCHHSATCVLFPSYSNPITNYNDIPLDNICNESTSNRPYLYIKPNNANYWKTYIPLHVNNINTGNITVRDKNTMRKSIEIILSEIPSKNVLWAYKDRTLKDLINGKDVTSVISWTNEKVVIKLGKKKPPMTVNRGQVITCDKYLSKLLTQKIKQCKQKGIICDREKIFQHSRRIKTANKLKKQRKNQFGANTIVKESAPVNSRYFNDTNDNNIPDFIPYYEDTTKQLLSLFNLESVPDDMIKPPQRELKLSDIEKYSLILIVGPSGSGKSTLLKSIQASNPSSVTFLDPNNLEWDNNKCVISQFSDVSVKKAMEYMSSIGLNNVRTWLKPVYICSTGEKYRCGMARSFKENVKIRKEIKNKNKNINTNKNTNGEKNFIVIDEYGSVLDPTTARCMAVATGKCVRKNNLNFILASGNADIIRYLQPDLLVLLGSNNEMKLIENPNNLNNNLFDVKAVLDLPPFCKNRQTDSNYNADAFKSIRKLQVFDDLKPYSQPITIDKEVRELKCRVIMDHHAKEIATVLDVEDFNGECVTHIPCLQHKHICMNNWNIGIIVGPSGCGKTTSGERLFGRPKDIKWDYQRNIASHFKNIINLKELFIAVDLPLNIGFSNYNLLSEGEQHRVNIARYLDGQNGNNNVLIDEFTSYLDRITAKKVAKGVSDYIYKYNKQNIVFLCCKYDIISNKNGMYPSWIFDVSNKKITHYKPRNNIKYNNNVLKLYPKHELISIKNSFNPPKIRLVMKRCTKYDFSPTFSRYHYMDASINGSAKCFSVWAYFSYQKDKNNNKNKNKNKRSDKEEASDSDEKEEEEEEYDEGYYNEDELELVGFTSFLNHYGSNNVTMYDDSIKHINYREHRTVVLPSFQGLGFGSRIADCIGEYLSLHGQRLHSKTAHPRYGGYRDKKPTPMQLWIPTKRNHLKQARKQWKKDVDRMVWGGQLKSIGLEKLYFIHVYKLQNERNKNVNQLLKSRVIVKKVYKPLTE